jgi:hypothetical protein
MKIAGKFHAPDVLPAGSFPRQDRRVGVQQRRSDCSTDNFLLLTESGTVKSAYSLSSFLNICNAKIVIALQY